MSQAFKRFVTWRSESGLLATSCKKRRECVMNAWPARAPWQLTVGSNLRAILGKLQV